MGILKNIRSLPDYPIIHLPVVASHYIDENGPGKLCLGQFEDFSSLFDTLIDGHRTKYKEKNSLFKANLYKMSANEVHIMMLNHDGRIDGEERYGDKAQDGGQSGHQYGPRPGFSCLNAGPRRREQGMSLGPAVVKRVADSYGWKIAAEPVPGGACFRITIPLDSH
ncbi:MAG: hypothetical protein LBK08_04775 [Treponema sp.]|nr:hypothetical protein [Treponema sp.]